MTRRSCEQHAAGHLVPPSWRRVGPALSDLPVRKVTRALEAAGFERVRVKGSHAVYRRAQDGKVAVVPEHGTVKRGTPRLDPAAGRADPERVPGPARLTGAVVEAFVGLRGRRAEPDLRHYRLPASRVQPRKQLTPGVTATVATLDASDHCPVSDPVAGRGVMSATASVPSPAHAVGRRRAGVVSVAGADPGVVAAVVERVLILEAG
jgi:predicted RNA binding protein YcfA (HicA-like mRNA interferase family)